MAVSRRTVTVLFADVADSTPLGERLDPESLRRVMSRWFERMSEVLERHGGTVEKFIGDAVMAVFGIPELHEDDALRAVRAGTELRAALAQLNDELERELGVRIGIRVGINTGEVVAGDGTGGQMLVTGDPVNVAKRLEEAARTGEILLGDTTRRLVENAALLEPRDDLTLKGKSAAVTAWNALAVIEGAPAYARRPDAPLVGRTNELRILRDAFAAAVADRACRLVTVVGPAGIGKSRLSAELCHGVRDEARTLTGRCLPYGDGITFWPLVQIIGFLGGESGIRKLLADTDDGDLVAERVLSAVGPTGVNSAGGEMFWAVRRLVEEIAREQPLLLMIEDIHWAAPTLLDLLEYLAGWTHDAPVLLLCLARPDLTEARPAWLTSPNASGLVLGPLSEEDTDALLAELAQEWPLSADARAQIKEAAEGNPLYVEQMAAMLAEGGSAGSIPPSIQALLAARLDRLPVDERAVLERAAVAGKEFVRTAVLQLSDGAEREDVDSQLLSLARKDLLTARPGREDAYRFRHALIRDAAYAGIAKELRAELHERFAEWASRTTAGRAGELDEIVGYHYEQAFRYREQLGPVKEKERLLSGRAAEILGEAGRRAYARDDMPAAINLLDRAVALASGQDPAQLGLHRELSNALWSVGELARAEALLDGIIAAAEAAADPRERWHALLERSGRLSVTHPEAEDELLETAEQAIEVFTELGDDLGVARAWRRISAVHRLSCRFATASEAAEVGLVHARRARAVQDEARLVDEICTSLLFGPAHVEQAIQRCESLLSESRESRVTTANVSCSLAGLRAMRGDFEEARASLAVARLVYGDLGLRFAIAGLSQIAGSVEMLAGDIDASERAFRDGYDILAQVGARGVLAAELSQTLVAQGRVAEASEYLAIAEQASGGDIAPQIICRSVKARIALAEQDVAAAVELATVAASLAEQTDALTMIGDATLTKSEVLQAAGREAEAKTAAERALACYTQKGHVLGARAAEHLVSSRISAGP
ncbi:MAG: AAA family ATPase [Actinobacteria bacterium]|nr:AAA family ATPase [Actinomycetota bacterium]